MRLSREKDRWEREGVQELSPWARCLGIRKMRAIAKETKRDWSPGVRRVMLLGSVGVKGS